MYGIKSTSGLETGDILVAKASVNARQLPLSFSPVIFVTGQAMGTVTDANRTGTDGKTYVDFKDAQGRSLTIEKSLTLEPLASVSYRANTDYNYPTSSAGIPATSQIAIVPGDEPVKSSGGLFGKILGGLETVRDIIVGVKKTPATTSTDAEGTGSDTGDKAPAGTTADGGGNASLYWMIGGGLVIVTATIGLIVYLKKRKKTAAKAPAN